MNRRSAYPVPLPFAPPAYDRDFINKIVRVLNANAIDSTTPGDDVVASLLFVNPPGTGYGLPTGGTWVDGAGYMRSVLSTDVFAPSTQIRLKPGKVTVTT